MDQKRLKIFAPAKINLFLHVTGRREDGYHLLESLVAFADIGDAIEIKAGHDFKFNASGPYAGAFRDKDLDSSPHSSNLVVRAAWGLSKIAKKPLNLSITLQKNLPLMAGIGGGSSDAAATLWGLMDFWDMDIQNIRHTDHFKSLMLELGADVPVCLSCEPQIMRGIGEEISPVPPLPETPIVLVFPGQSSPTPAVFRHYARDFTPPVEIPENLSVFDDFISFLSRQDNDLFEPAAELVPEIKNGLYALEAQKDCALARMTGSGSTCFGIFEDHNAAAQAARNIADENPDWWVRAGWLNLPRRY